MWFVAILIGLLSVFIGVMILRHELNQALRAVPKDMDSSVKRSDLDELNASFFDIANDLEGKYSIHEKQILTIEEGMLEMRSRLDGLSSGGNKKVLPHPDVQEARPNSKKRELNSKTREPNRTEKTEDSRTFNEQNVLKEKEMRQEFEPRNADKKREAQVLLAEGYSVSEIAKKLGMGVSELSLMKNIDSPVDIL